MLTVILSVLRIIGLTLLILLGVVLVLLGLILFMPIVYRIKGRKQEKPEAEVRIRWLFGFLRASFCYPDPGSFIVKVLFFTVYDTGKEEKSSPEENADEDPLSEEEAELLFESIDSDESVDLDDSKSEVEVIAPKEPGFQEPKEPESKMDSAPKDVKESKIDKIKYTFRNTCDKIKNIWENITYYKDIFDENETRRLLDHVLCRIGKILKSIRPRKLEADLLFGTGSPDTTGYLLGVYGMLSPVLGDHFTVTPDFEESVLKGTFYAAGHITIAKILWQGIWVVLDKKLWRFISKVKKEKKNGK